MKQTLNVNLNLTIQASGSRPQPTGLNTSSVQYQNLLAVFPLWLTSTSANQVDLKAGLVGTPSSILIGNDPVFGPCFKGDGTARRYTVPYPSILDFYKSGTSYPFSVTCWVNISISATSLTNSNNPPNAYVYTFDNPNPAYPGHSVAISRQFSGSNTNIVTEFDVDSGVAQVSDFGNKVINDGKWHHLACVYNCPSGANQNTSHIPGLIYVDGVLDTQSNGSTQDFYYYGIGSPGTSQPLYIGTDDDGKTSCFNGLFCDLRFYSGVLPLTTIQAMQSGKSTQWELYN